MADEDFRLPGSSYDELVKIVRGYGHLDGPVPLPEIASVAGLHTTSVSRNNAFLVSVGIVEGGQRKAITETGKSLSRALEHDIVDEIAAGWRAIVTKNPFFQKLIAAIRIRRGMDESTLQAHVAYTAGQKKSASVMTGAAAVVEIMKVAGVVREDNGKLVATDDVQQTPESTDAATVDKGHGSPPRLSPTYPLAQSRKPVTEQSGATLVNVTIQLNIQCGPEQLDEVSTKVRALIDRLSDAGGQRE